MDRTNERLFRRLNATWTSFFRSLARCLSRSNNCMIDTTCNISHTPYIRSGPQDLSILKQCIVITTMTSRPDFLDGMFNSRPLLVLLQPGSGEWNLLFQTRHKQVLVPIKGKKLYGECEDLRY